ncbi:sigma-70 family RNA polymerase sigma factor [Porticoccaceae bacterium LTM1]|nr:sigma-70 family RNA polymerase sigma factor [Porticoccaceae bacterium LTM1]
MTEDNVLYLVGRERSPSKLVERVFLDHGDALRRFLHARLALEEDREDLIQEVFLKLMRQHNLEEKLSSQSGNTLNYLYAMASSLIVDMKRRQTSLRQNDHCSYIDDVLPGQTPEPEQIAIDRQKISRLQKGVDSLKPEHSTVLFKNRLEMKSCRQISEEMGLSRPTIERYLASALSILRIKMEAYDE